MSGIASANKADVEDYVDVDVDVEDYVDVDVFRCARLRTRRMNFAHPPPLGRENSRKIWEISQPWVTPLWEMGIS